MFALLAPLFTQLLGGNWAIILRVAGIVLLVGGLWFWWHSDREDYAQDQVQAVLAEQAKEGMRIAAARQVITERVVTQFRVIEGKTKIVSEEITKEVVRYAEKNPDGAVIDSEWLRILNAAALNQRPVPGQRPDGQVRPAEGNRVDDRGRGVTVHHEQLRCPPSVCGSSGRLAAVP